MMRSFWLSARTDPALKPKASMNETINMRFIGSPHDGDCGAKSARRPLPKPYYRITGGSSVSLLRDADGPIGRSNAHIRSRIRTPAGRLRLDFLIPRRPQLGPQHLQLLVPVFTRVR